MKKTIAILGMAAGIAMIGATPSFALDSSFDALSKSGTHKFYVWCTGKADSEQSAQGANAKEAQAALASKVGDTCWPVWQGLESK